MKKKELLLVGFHFLHHSSVSGYDQIINFIDADYLDSNKLPFGDSSFSSWKRRINFFFLEFCLIFKGCKYKTIHLLYTENFFLFSLLFYAQKVVATLHLPVEETFDLSINNNLLKWIFRRYKIFILRKVDVFIVLSRDEQKKLSLVFPNKKVYFIPHGIYTVSQKKLVSEMNNKDFRIAIVGKNYRDLALSCEIIQMAATLFPDWKFSLIGVYSNWKDSLSCFSSVSFYNNLSASEYQIEFAACDIHLLPVTFSTANNAILEAHVFGVPTLASDLESIKDYSVSTTLFFSSALEALEILANFYNKPAHERFIIRENTVKESIKFNWKEISSLTISSYER